VLPHSAHLAVKDKVPGKREPRLTTLKRIADALRVAPATLMADGLGTVEPSASSSAGGYDL
jgi:hypothetical protein